MSKKTTAVLKVVALVLATMYVARRIKVVDELLATGSSADLYLV